MKVYAVNVGKVPGIYNSWPECNSQVSGYKGAIYKSFPTRQEALNYLGLSQEQSSTIIETSNVNNSNPPSQNLTNRAQIKHNQMLIQDSKSSGWNFDKYMTIFVDGGFNRITKPNAYGSVTNFTGQDLILYNKELLRDMNIIHVNLPVGDRDVIVSYFNGVTQQNNGAELLAAIAGLRIALYYNVNGVPVRHIASDSKLIVESWSIRIKSESEATFCQRKVAYIKELIWLRQKFESIGGRIEKIDADGPLGNPADVRIKIIEPISSESTNILQ